MSIHKSLKSTGGLARSRNVLTRYERILELERVGKFKGGDDSPFGLPKVRVQKTKHRAKKKKEEEATTEGETTEEPTTTS